ncbi:hypothetical protein SLEP1_g2572 [Rubroshorea leprosula]|uniref:Peptidase S8/S53 domain-containing protein n=1 Tax=Rubroshorea leprosula TaxID=152421 RepID=A0AAV5HNF4_9ROSI|nr:hypothetical protein SLEP1_g2572 [Rubroshorea leprosula]
MDAFVTTIPDRSMRLYTTYDTSIWPEHPSFQNHGFGPVPAKWKGAYESDTNFSPLNCNHKLIGARYFLKGCKAVQGKINETKNFRSPKATTSHGTHCASTTGNNLAQNASFYSLANGVATGMRYTSRIVVYKVCWEAPASCAYADTLVAIDQAIKDGVDMVSISIGFEEGGAVSYFEDSTAQAAFVGIQRGIFLSLSVGNEGPCTIGNTAPTLIGASLQLSSLERDKFLKGYLFSAGGEARKPILSYLNSTNSPTASLTFKGTAYGKRAPMVATFPSRGPNLVSPDLLKPDLIAPGLNILAVWASITSPSGKESDKRRVMFNFDSRTSMSCLHDNKGSPIKDFYHGGPATTFAIGSGHVDIQKASDPRLLYDIHPLEYLLYLCSLKYLLR